MSTAARILLNFKLMGQMSRSLDWIFGYFIIAR